jgi:hypothetical protein
MHKILKASWQPVNGSTSNFSKVQRPQEKSKKVDVNSFFAAAKTKCLKLPTIFGIEHFQKKLYY